MSESPQVIIKVSNVSLEVCGKINEDLRKEIQTKLSYVMPGFQYMPSYKAMVEKAKELGVDPEWDGTKTVALWSDYHQRLRCPTGLLSYIREILDARQIPFVLQEQRLASVHSTGWSTEGLILRDYQDSASVGVLTRQRGVLKIATGGGKTKTILHAIVNAGCFPTIFYVPSCDLLEQAHEEFTKHVRYNGLPVKIGRIGNGHCDLQPITIATVQSCERALTGTFTKYEFDDYEPDDDETGFSEQQRSQICELVKEAQFVYVDECQHTSAATIQSILNASHRARYRIGGSASPWRDDGLDILIEACFGRKICDVSASFLIQQGWLVRPHIVFNHFRQSLGKTASFQAHYKTFVSENVARNQWIAKRAQFHVERNRPTIIIVKWSTHAENLAEIISGLFSGCEVLTSSGKLKRSANKRKKVLEQMRERKINCIIGTTLLDEGVDVPVATSAILAGGGKSSTRALQRVGRIIRPDPLDWGKPQSEWLKDTAYVEEIFDHCRFLDHHARARRRIYETEREFDIADNWETQIY